MTEPTGPARDSSLQDRKAPGNVSLTHPAAPPRQCSRAFAVPPDMPTSVARLTANLSRCDARPAGRPVWLSFLAMLSMRSAAEVKAATSAAWVACARSAATTRASCRAASSSSSRADLLGRFRQFVGDHQRRHDGQPRVADLAELAAQRGDALVEVAWRAAADGLPAPSSQAMRNWRPLMVTFTCDT